MYGIYRPYSLYNSLGFRVVASDRGPGSSHHNGRAPSGQVVPPEVGVALEDGDGYFVVYVDSFQEHPHEHSCSPELQQDVERLAKVCLGGTGNSFFLIYAPQ